MIFDTYANNYCLTLYSIFSNSGHDFRRIKNPHTSSVHNTPRNIHLEFGSNWSSSVRGEEFWKIILTIRDDDGYQMMEIAHMAFRQVS